jgi:ribosomal protein L11 methyltransferase
MTAPASQKERGAPEYFAWKKLSASKWDDAWLERLSFLGPQRVMVISFPNAPKIRVEAHGLSRTEADRLREHFGGTVSAAKPMVIKPVKRPPLKIRSRLLIVSSGDELRELNQKDAEKAVLIPAGMAFGTGDHATTAGCLRFLVDVAAEYGANDWEMLDLGTGSGILGIAGRKLGARRVLAGDFDPHAVRVAKENVKANGSAGVTVKKMDVLTWEPERTWPVVAANLFSGLLIEIAPKLARAVACGRDSDIFGSAREQEAEVTRALEKEGFKLDRMVRKGNGLRGDLRAGVLRDTMENNMQPLRRGARLLMRTEIILTTALERATSLRRRAYDDVDIKFACKQCGQRMLVETAAAGLTGDCPSCGSAVTVPHVHALDDREYNTASVRPREAVSHGRSSGRRIVTRHRRRRPPQKHRSSAIWQPPNEELVFCGSSSRRKRGEQPPDGEFHACAGGNQKLSDGASNLKTELTTARQRLAAAEARLQTLEQELAQATTARAEVEAIRIELAHNLELTQQRSAA